MHRGWMIIVLLGLALPALCAAHPSIYPTGVTLYKPHKAYNGYVLFAAADKRTYLIDMDGNVVRHWNRAGFPSLALTPRQAGGQRGHLLVQLDKTPHPDKLAGHSNGLNNMIIGEVDWNDDVIWHWGTKDSPGGGAHQNHDIRRLANGNTLIDEGQDGRLFQITPKGEIVWEYVSPYFGNKVTNAVYRAQPAPYDWAPPGTTHEERPVHGVLTGH